MADESEGELAESGAVRPETPCGCQGPVAAYLGCRHVYYLCLECGQTWFEDISITPLLTPMWDG